MIENNWSYQYQKDSILIGFGKKQSSVEKWQNAFPETRVFHLKQVHGKKILSTEQIKEYTQQNLPAEADGLWTDQSFQSLGIITADCIPLFLWSQNQSLIMGLHAGWRGVAGQILHEGVNIFAKKGTDSKNINIAIGPHISQENFEVQEDVLHLILSSIDIPDKSHLFIEKDNGKFTVNLLEVLKIQIKNLGIPQDQVLELSLDTYSSQDFHSFRRDGTQAGRQISFIVKKDSL